MDFIIELWQFIKIRKKFWLLPIIIILMLLGVIIVLAKGSVIAPFLYTMF